MIQIDTLNIKELALHKVGNKFQDDGIVISKDIIKIDEIICTLLSKYFLQSFRFDQLFRFFNEVDISFNEVNGIVSKIFESPKSLYDQSVSLAKHLYEQSNHPKIKGGEFYVVYFKNCIVDGEAVDAVGLFKSENKDTFLKVYPSGNGFEIESQQGININKLDKGALIFNTDKENGYTVAVVDNTNKGSDAHYWIDDFLHVRLRHDEFYNTQNLMTLTKNFVAKELPKSFDGISKADQAELLNKTTKFFKKNDNFQMENFVNEVIGRPEVIDSFNQYKNSFSKERDIEFLDSFCISDSAVKKYSKSFKSVIKLDSNFDIYIHGDSHLIEKGVDYKGKFYKVYYKEEQ